MWLLVKDPSSQPITPPSPLHLLDMTRRVVPSIILILGVERSTGSGRGGTESGYRRMHCLQRRCHQARLSVNIWFLRHHVRGSCSETFWSWRWLQFFLYLLGFFFHWNHMCQMISTTLTRFSLDSLLSRALRLSEDLKFSQGWSKYMR